MSFITVPVQPPGVIAHGRHCSGGTPGWKVCESCARAQSQLCIAFWQTMGGVPPIVRQHIKARMAWYAQQKRRAAEEAAREAEAEKIAIAP